MAQRKGQTGNPNGRPKGTPNKVTTDLRTWINEILNNNRRQITNDLKKLEPYQRIAIFEKLLGYALPKLQSVEAKLDIDLNALSDTQLDMIITELSKQIEHD